MGEARKSTRRDPTAKFRAGAQRIRRLSPKDRVRLNAATMWGTALGGLGLLWPCSLSVFATIRGSMEHALIPGAENSKWKYQHVGDGWPVFRAPWAVPVVLILAAIALTVWSLRYRQMLASMTATLAFAWLGIGAGTVWVGLMYLGAQGWPVGQVWLGIPALVVAGAFWLYPRVFRRIRRPAR